MELGFMGQFTYSTQKYRLAVEEIASLVSSPVEKGWCSRDGRPTLDESTNTVELWSTALSETVDRNTARKILLLLGVRGSQKFVVHSRWAIPSSVVAALQGMSMCHKAVAPIGREHLTGDALVAFWGAVEELDGLLWKPRRELDSGDAIKKRVNDGSIEIHDDLSAVSVFSTKLSEKIRKTAHKLLSILGASMTTGKMIHREIGILYTVPMQAVYEVHALRLLNNRDYWFQVCHHDISSMNNHDGIGSVQESQIADWAATQGYYEEGHPVGPQLTR